ncbi:MAG: hypothetical protein ACYSUY_09140 [Planctomycetota bacterium]
MRKPDRLVDAYDASKVARNNITFLRQIRNALSFLEPRNYRGIAREPLEPWFSIDEELLKKGTSTLVDLGRERSARKIFLKINGEDREEWDYYKNGWDYNKSLIKDLDTAKELYGVLNNPEEYEVIEISREIYGSDYDFLGFDVGYWRSGEFSMICDSVLMPRWHPPDPNDLPELAERVRYLNQHVLFSTTEEAEKFREFCNSKPWAETENQAGEFEIIQIAEPKA